MVNFDFYNPVRIIFGAGSSSRLGEAAAQYGKTALIVSYASNSALEGLLCRSENALRAAGLKVATCYNVTANPMISQIKEGIKLCREEKADLIIGIGGGSAMDAAKAIGAGALYDGDVWDLYFSRHDRELKAKPSYSLPTVMVPTLPATSSEMNNIAVATNDGTREKSYMWGNALYPKASLIDPALTCSLPAYQTACGGVDAISHAMEAYFNCVPDTPLQDRLQEGAIVTIMELLPKVLKNPSDISLRTNIQWASTLCWNGWLQAGINPGSPMHQIGHVLTARFGITHGATLGIVMPAFFRYVMERRLGRFAQFGRRVFGLSGSDAEVAPKAIDMFERFISDMGVETRLSRAGVRVDDKTLEAAAGDVERVSCNAEGFLASDPPVGREDILKILKAAL